MSQSPIQRALTIFDRIIELPLESQEAALQSLAEEDATLAGLVRRLLAADQVHLSLPAALPAGVLSPGQQIGRYRVEALLGRGGMAEVWRVRHALLGTAHALKVLTRTDPQLRQRLLQEGRAQAALNHPNILPIHDLLELEDRLGLLMPLIEGPSLDSLLAEHRPSSSDAHALLVALTQGLAAAHQRGFVHRDLKPANVLLSLQAHQLIPRLADFGLVKPDTGGLQTRAGAVFGTPAYAAPEQLRDSASVDQRADIFSLGVVLVELFTGHRPFPGTSIAAILDAHRQAPDLSGDLPASLRALAAQMLQLDPHRRPASCAEILARLGPPAPLSWALVEAARGGSRLPEAAAPLASPPGTPAALSPQTDLPRVHTPLLGRDADLAAIESLLAEAALVTVLGFGGIGKTRLAIAAGRAMKARMPGGVWFIDLSEAQNHADILAATARVLGIRLGKTPGPQLASAIRQLGSTLLIFDNFEQVESHAAETVGAWSAEASRARFLITSRHPLRLRHEQQYPLDVLARTDAIALFAVHARLVDPRFRVSDDSRAVLAELVGLLDGLPLAIELAAARVRMLSLSQLRDRISERFRLLRSRSPDRPDRQLTLEATLRWSWELLTAEEQRGLAQCSVFEGGFTIEAAEDVLDEVGWAGDVIAGLLEKSLLVQQKGSDSGLRFTMLVSVHDFARRQLTEPQRAERRHIEHFTRRVLRARRRGERFQEWRTDLDNFLAASRRALPLRLSEEAALCAIVATRMSARTRPAAQLHALLSEIDAMPGLSSDTRLQVRTWLISTGWRTLHVEAVEALIRDSLALARAHGGKKSIGGFINHLGNAVQRRGALDEAEAHFQEALACFRAVGDRVREGTALGNLGTLQGRRGHFEDAIRSTRLALSIAQETRDQANEHIWLLNLGVVLKQIGDTDATLQAYRDALEIARSMGDKTKEGSALGALGNLYKALDRIEEAKETWEHALAIAEQLRDRRSQAYWQLNISQQSREEGRIDDAIERLRTAQRLSEDIGEQLPLALSTFLLGLSAKERGQPDGDPQIQTAVAILESLENHYQLLNLHTLQARSALDRSDAEEAAGAIRAAHRYAGRTRLPPDAPLRKRLAALEVRLAALSSPT